MTRPAARSLALLAVLVTGLATPAAAQMQLPAPPVPGPYPLMPVPMPYSQPGVSQRPAPVFPGPQAGMRVPYWMQQPAPGVPVGDAPAATGPGADYAPVPGVGRQGQPNQPYVPQPYWQPQGSWMQPPGWGAPQPGWGGPGWVIPQGGGGQ